MKIRHTQNAGMVMVSFPIGYYFPWWWFRAAPVRIILSGHLQLVQNTFHVVCCLQEADTNAFQHELSSGCVKYITQGRD